MLGAARRAVELWRPEERALRLADARGIRCLNMSEYRRCRGIEGGIREVGVGEVVAEVLLAKK